ncbi:MAG TPA: hypothetical protein VFR24_23470 [Candidatus Angelobacter sp.]|nr:hypothetical protein [Candidatus Angelobacter sp.]
MTVYSVDTAIRQSVYITVATLSIGISYGLVHAFGKYELYKVAAPSAGAICALVLWFFDHMLWRIRGFNQFLGIPNLNGEWKGVVNKPNAGTPLDVTVTISQTFHKLSIVLETATTRSRSEVIGLFVQDSRQITVQYTYIVKYTSGAQAGTPYGHGTNELTLRSEQKGLILKGPYYSSHSKNGSVEVRLARTT